MDAIDRHDQQRPTQAGEHASFKCGSCNQQFSRSEHLKRHIQTHGSSEAIRCSYCERTFSRKDSAQRHERLHNKDVNGQERSILPSSLRRTCTACTKSRIKCSGGTPCTYCAAKHFTCSYQPRKRRQRRIISNTNQDLLIPGCQTGTSPTDNDGALTLESPSMADTPEAASNWHETRMQNQIASSVPTARPNLVQDEMPDVNHGSQGLLTDLGLVPGPETVSTAHDSTENHLLPINWLPFDSIPINNLMLHSPDDIPHPAGQVEEESMAPYQDFYIQSPLSNQSDTPGLTLQQGHVSALIAAMAADKPRAQTQATNTDLSPSNTRAVHYSDGAGFRESRAERYIRQRRTVYAEDQESSSGLQAPTSWLADLNAKAASTERNTKSQNDIPDSIFLELMSRLKSHQNTSSILGKFANYNTLLLNKPVFVLFVDLYFEHFHPINPFIDRSHISIPLWGWSLCLATAAIGAKYFGSKEISSLGDCLCAILHELLIRELDFIVSEEPLPYIQARILVSVGLSQTHQPEFSRCGHNALGMVAQACLQHHLLNEDDSIGSFGDDQSLEQVWVSWRFRETRRRTGFLAWLTNCYLALASSHRPLSFPGKPLLKLPCRESLWTAESPRAWFEALSTGDINKAAFAAEESARPLAHEVTLKLWRSLEAFYPTNSFATIIIIHMLVYHRWNANEYLADPIYHELEGNLPNAPSAQRVYLGSIPEHIKWRNQCCDCLDVLHWEASSQSARAQGLEDPVLLHLHLSRLLILTPVENLIVFCRQNTVSDTNWSTAHRIYSQSTSYRESKRAIRIWATQDRYKARLAVIHAGAVLWHVRRYSSDSIVEPFTLFLAALVLWAYGKTSSIRKLHEDTSARDHSPLHEDDGSSSSSTSNLEPVNKLLAYNNTVSRRRRMPSIMQLDRPMDDELVQYFIRSGESLRLIFEGVDDLCSDNGPCQVLDEVLNILMEQHKPWGICEIYARLLQDLKTTQWQV